LVPDVRDCDVPRVTPSVSLVPIVTLSDVPSVRDFDVLCETPFDCPVFQPSDFVVFVERLSLLPSVTPGS
jgi:hypothetical protein